MKVFITGGTSGIGLALTKHYLRAGWDVGICGGDRLFFKQQFPTPPPHLKFYELDVTDAAACQSVIREFSGHALDLLIASAGINNGKPASSELDWPREREIFAVNLGGVVNTFAAALAVMEKQGRGQLIALSSAAGFAGFPQTPAYCASKAAVITYCESLAIRLRPLGIQVGVIAPGYVDTPMARATQPQLNRNPFLISSETAAQHIAKAIAQGRSLYIFPLSTRILVQVLRLLPRSLFRWGFRNATRKNPPMPQKERCL